MPIGFTIILLILTTTLPVYCESTTQTLTRIAFGSCNLQRVTNQTAWEHIADFDPQLFIWLGDVIYGDTMFMPFVWFPSPIEELKAKYEIQLQNPFYKAFVHRIGASNIIGVYDDHDYNNNNGGKEYVNKTASQQLFLDFIGEPPDSPRRRQQGVYTSYTYGQGDRQVKLILLDTRYHRDPYASIFEDIFSSKPHEGDVLGEEQWRWLENELRESKAALNIIGSSIQLIPDDKVKAESWGRFPYARQRFLNLVRDSRARGVVIISGDVHFGEISVLSPVATTTGRTPCCLELPYTLYEVTSSGLTHCIESVPPYSGMRYLLKHILSANYRLGGPENVFTQKNFGTLIIDWDHRTLTMSVHDINGTVVIAHRVDIDTLVPRSDAEYQQALVNLADNAQCRFDSPKWRECVTVGKQFTPKVVLTLIILLLIALVMLVIIVGIISLAARACIRACFDTSQSSARSLGRKSKHSTRRKRSSKAD